jgi:Uma2 family endonuclease
MIRHKFDIEQFHQLAELGFFGEDDRVELIDGDILNMSPIGKAHKACVSRLTRMLVQAYAELAVIYVQNPLIVAGSEPLPDLAVLEPDPSHYATRDATAADALLVIEVADSSKYYDATTKATLYASGDIAEYWLIDLSAGAVHIYRQPHQGNYTDEQTYEDGTISARAFADITFNVNYILGKESTWH